MHANTYCMYCWYQRSIQQSSLHNQKQMCRIHHHHTHNTIHIILTIPNTVWLVITIVIVTVVISVLWCTSATKKVDIIISSSTGRSGFLRVGIIIFGAQQKNLCSLVLKLKKRAALYFQVLTGALHTVYHESSPLFLNCTRYFFQRDTSRKQLQQEFPRSTLWLKLVTVAAVYIYTCSSLQQHKIDTKVFYVARQAGVQRRSTLIGDAHI